VTRSVNYDSIAGQYDKRYHTNNYGHVLDLLLNFFHSVESRPILEVGCGTGYWLSELTQRGFEVMGIDPSLAMLQEARRKTHDIKIVQGVAEALPWADGTFSRLFCLNSFHHFSDKTVFTAEARRILQKGGGIFIVGLDPHNGVDTWWIYDYFPQVVSIDKKRYTSTPAIRDLLKAYGFQRCNTVEALHMPIRIAAQVALESGQLAKSTTSQLTILTDDEYQEGMSRLVQDINAAEEQGLTHYIGADLRLYATTGWVE
jgi:ubiquinone/menaquinone biosynthesis C-methylase UbiE